MKKIVSVLLLLAVLALTSDALANKPSVAIVAPESVEAGTEVTIALNVSHKGNSFLHFTNWVVVKADGVEIARWDFKKLPAARKRELQPRSQIQGREIRGDHRPGTLQHSRQPGSDRLQDHGQIG